MRLRLKPPEAAFLAYITAIREEYEQEELLKQLVDGGVEDDIDLDLTQGTLEQVLLHANLDDERRGSVEKLFEKMARAMS